MRTLPTIAVATLSACCPQLTADHPRSTVVTAPTPPVAARRSHSIGSPNGTRDDPYYWLRDDTRKDPEVLAYLAAENAYARAVMEDSAATEQAVFDELRARTAEDDTSVPVFEDGYWHYRRVVAGKQHPIYARRQGSMSSPEEILVDGNQLATGHAFYVIGAVRTSPDGRYVAWTDDAIGRRQFVLHVRDLRDGRMLSDRAIDLAPEIEWSNDNQTIFFVGKDPTTLRESRVVRHPLGGSDTVVFEERDETFSLSIGATKSHRYIAVMSAATDSTETRLIDADRPSEPPRVFRPREPNHRYNLDHLDGRFVVVTNLNARNFRVVEVAADRGSDTASWRELYPHRSDVLIENVAVYHGFLAASIRSGGLAKIEVRTPDRAPVLLDAPDPAYAMEVIDTPDRDAKRFRFAYQSLTTPSTIYEADPSGSNRTQLKREPVPTYDPAGYASEYIHATASDGTKIPISVVYKKSTPRDGSAPLLLLGYGSYGVSLSPGFRSSWVSLLDRGWVCAIAHIRGGQEMGRAWYEDGRLLHKRNTFTDFIAATEHLVTGRYGARDRIYAMGGSAGGLLIGAVANLRPDLYRGMVALVPFVDVVTTMLDESIPLTTGEFTEWGNPKQKAFYDYMLGYSPYDNVRATRYPALYVKTGLWDSQVQYYEPAKWVAKLRATKTDRNVLVFDIDMSAGHGGAAGRYDRLRDFARVAAFLLRVDRRGAQ